MHVSNAIRASRTSQYAFLSALFKIPYSNGRIVARSRKPAIVWTETQSTNSLPMSRPCIQVVHVRLKVLDDTALICRREVGTRMCKLKGTNGRIMGLQDSLKVERQTVPEREFAARRAGQYAPSLGCPLEKLFNTRMRDEEQFRTDRHDVDRTTNFVRRGVYELGAQGRRCITRVGDGREELIDVIIRLACTASYRLKNNPYVNYVRWSRSHKRYICRIRTVFSQLGKLSLRGHMSCGTRWRTNAHLPIPPLKSTVRRGLVFLTAFPSASCRAAASSCSRTFASSTGGGCGPVR